MINLKIFFSGIIKYFDLNLRYEEALVKRSKKLDPSKLRALGTEGEDIDKKPLKWYEQVIMFVAVFLAIKISS